MLVQQVTGEYRTGHKHHALPASGGCAQPPGPGLFQVRRLGFPVRSPQFQLPLRPGDHGLGIAQPVVHSIPELYFCFFPAAVQGRLQTLGKFQLPLPLLNQSSGVAAQCLGNNTQGKPIFSTLICLLFQIGLGPLGHLIIELGRVRQCRQ